VTRGMSTDGFEGSSDTDTIEYTDNDSTYNIYASSSKLVAIHLLTYVVRFIKMNLPFKFLLIWINDCGFIGSVGKLYSFRIEIYKLQCI
jgi:hypothetical protein